MNLAALLPPAQGAIQGQEGGQASMGSQGRWGGDQSAPHPPPTIPSGEQAVMPTCRVAPGNAAPFSWNTTPELATQNTRAKYLECDIKTQDVCI